MQRNKGSYALNSAQSKEIKQKMLNWANQSSVFIFLDSNDYQTNYKGYECLLAVDGIDTSPGNVPDGDFLLWLQALHDTNRDWIFGHICYEYKNILEAALTSSHAEKTGFPIFHFFIPTTVCHLNREQTILTIESFEDPGRIYNAISATAVPGLSELPRIEFTKVINQESYLNTVGALRRHIGDGDCYEINFCTEGFSESAVLDPLAAFNKLNALSPAPFAAFYRLGDRYMMCASPERYLRKEGGQILSQPIKGTARRDKNEQTDERIKNTLQNDPKERAENVMIVDLVRNDLARCCETGSVRVDELFGIYSFPQVHQLISTVSGALRSGTPFTEAIRHSFPMGSMTGAPKYKVMQLIEEYERSGRGLYSGTVGYITPECDFDFNVVIRSLFYNSATHYLCYHTGGAITYDSNEQQEWEEMRLKAWALERIFA